MSEYINFFGLGIELGQEKSGLAVSHRYAKKYFPLLDQLGVNLIDRGEIFLQPQQEKLKIKNNSELKDLNLEPYKRAFDKVKSLLDSRTKLVNWGGDHSVALSTVGAFLAKNPEGYILWIDAHGDLNLPSYSPTGNLHGMPLAILLNLENIQKKHFPWMEFCLDPEKLIYLGVRDLDAFEQATIKNMGIKSYTSQDVRKFGISKIADEILKATEGHALHISFDIDSVDPTQAPATGIQVPHGLTIDDIEILGSVLSAHQDIKSLDVVEVNPLVGSSTQVNQTFLTAFTFLVSVLNQGGEYDGIRRADQALYAAQMEQGSQI